MKISDYFSWKQPIKIGKEIGIEVEVESNNELPTIINGFPEWLAKNDGSLRGPFNKEYVTNGVLSISEYKKCIDGLYEALEIPKINDSRRCGVHIHLNVREYEIEKVFNIITIYLMLENLLIKWAGKNREGNLFCLRAKDAEYLVYKLIDDKKRGVFKDTLVYEDFKYASINVSTISKFGSLEFRALETPQDKNKIIKWIKILLSVKNYALNVNDIEKEFYKLSKNGIASYIENIFDSVIAKELIKIPNYNELVIDSVREAQPIGYTKLGNIEIPVKKKIKSIDDIERFVFRRVEVPVEPIAFNR